MKQFQVITDTTSDVEKTYRDQLEIDYLKMVYTIAGKDYDADLDWPELSAKEYYDSMRKGNRSVTGQVKITEIETKFKKYLDMGLDVLYIGCSLKLSSSVNTARSYADEILENYPDRKIVCFDSMRSNYAEGMMAMDAAKMALDGKSLAETVNYLDVNKLKYQTFATVGTLDWLKKAGRIKASKAFFGNLFGVKPIILGDAKGNNYAYKKVKGRKTSLDELIETIAVRMTDPVNTELHIEHADCEADANYIAETVKTRLNAKKVFVSPLGPIIGATVGPDAITVNFFGEEVTIVGEE